MKTIIFLACSCLIFLTACSNLVLKQTNFAWPVESVINVDNEGNVEIQRYSESFNVKPLYFKEMGDSLAYQNQQIRVIRNEKGFYFMTANNFKNVYVFSMDDGRLVLDKKIEISKEAGVTNPAFNQRPPYIEFVYGENNGSKVNLTEKGIKKAEE
jgi:hypothetical protein